jgi:hypothetical protein
MLNEWNSKVELTRQANIIFLKVGINREMELLLP